MTTPSLFDRPIAHRGFHDASNGIIENSRSAFQAAIDRNFGIECDLQVTNDKEAVVFHDLRTERLLGKEGRVIDSEVAEIRAMPLLGSAAGDCPQTFAELLEQVAGRVPLVVEIKQQAYPVETKVLTERAIEIARQYNGLIAFKSFDPLALHTLHKSGFQGPLGIVTYDYKDNDHLSGVQKFLLRNTLHRGVSRFTFVSCESSALTRPMIRFRRARGMKVMSWTVRSPEQAAQALQHADQIVFEGFDPEA